MGLFFKRSLENPSTSLANPDAWLWDAFGATPSASGSRVNERTALGASAVFACVRVLSSTIAQLPLVTYLRLERGKERAPGHPLYPLLHDRPNPEMSSFNFRETLQGHLMTWGNAYAEIERNNDGSVRSLWPLSPSATRPGRRPGGEKYYETSVAGRTFALRAEDVLHIPGLGFDGMVGYSPIHLHRQSIGLALATEEFGARFFGAGTRPTGVLTHPGKLSPDAKEKVRAGWTSAYGGLANSHRTAILEEGVTWQALGIPPEDAQFLETRRFQIAEIARIYGVPLHMIAELGNATFSNIEHQAIEYVTHSVLPVAVRWEQAMNHGLVPVRERATHFVEFLVEGLLRGDSAQRSAYYTALFNVAALSVNDIREKENLNPVEGGDQRFVPLNTVPLDLARTIAERPKGSAAPVTGRGLSVGPETLVPLCRDVADRMLKREVVQLRRAVKRGAEGFTVWLEEFYVEHQETVARAYVPVLESVARLVLPADHAARFAREWAEDCATRATIHARHELTALAGEPGERFEARGLDVAERWESGRVAAIAQDDAARVGRALADEITYFIGVAA